MRIIKLICFFFLLILFINSCKEESKIKEKSTTIDITKSFEKESKINLSTIAQEIEYVQLESSKTGLLDRIRVVGKDIQFFNDYILIKDVQSNLLLFDVLGNFITKIGQLGNGPGEYTRIDELIALPDKNLISVYSAGQQKVLIYNLEGGFEYSFKIDFWPLGISYFNNSLVFFNTIGRRSLTDYFALSLIDTEGKLIKRLHYKEKEKKFEKSNELELKTIRLNSFILNDTLRFWEGDYGRDVIWSLTKEKKIVPYNSILYDDENLWTLDMYSKSKKIGFEEMIKFSNIEDYLESTMYQFFRIAYKKDNKMHNILYNKKTKESHWVRYKNENRKGGNSKFFNDLDGGMPFWPQGKVSDNKIFMILYGYELKDYLSKHVNNMKFKNNKTRESLLKLAENSKISDNPILMIVTLKK